VAWQEDLFASADEDSRYTTQVEEFLGAHYELMANCLPEKGIILEIGQYGEPKLPPKAERVYGKPGRATSSAMRSTSAAGSSSNC
jgi:ParB family chromosome partitioning protein